jgi:hypothetical protein
MLRGGFFGALAATGVLGAAHADPDLEAASVPARLRRVRAIRAASAFKAFMKGDTVFPETVEPVADGSAVVDQTRSPLTIGGELDKLASNDALGRCAAGVHFRADCIAGLRLGELAALSVLRDRAKAAPRRHGPFVVRTFDGKMLEIGG